MTDDSSALLRTETSGGVNSKLAFSLAEDVHVAVDSGTALTNGLGSGDSGTEEPEGAEGSEDILTDSLGVDDTGSVKGLENGLLASFVGSGGLLSDSSNFF